MDIYDAFNYSKKRTPIYKNIVELFTQKEEIGFYRMQFNQILRRPLKISFGANYGLNKPGGSHFLRGIEIGNLVYEIDVETKKIIKHSKKPHKNLWILSEMDKLDENVIIDGRLEEVLNAFVNAGYSMVE